MVKNYFHGKEHKKICGGGSGHGPSRTVTVRHGSDRQGTIFFTKALVHIGCSCMLHNITGWGLGYDNLCPLHGPSYLF